MVICTVINGVRDGVGGVRQATNHHSPAAEVGNTTATVGARTVPRVLKSQATAQRRRRRQSANITIGAYSEQQI